MLHLSNKLQHEVSSPSSIYLRVSLTNRCNLQCRYCTDKKLRKQEEIRLDSLLRVLSFLDGVVPIRVLRLTGGEPLLFGNLVALLKELRPRFPQTELCLTTNGMLLTKKANLLKTSGIDRINVSLDSLDEHIFKEIAGRGRLTSVIQGIEIASRLSFKEIKINCVLLRSLSPQGLGELVAFAVENGCKIQFIELMPIGPGKHLFVDQFLPAKAAIKALSKSFHHVGEKMLRTRGPVHIFEVAGKNIEIRFIAPVSSPFCGSCDRLRMDSCAKLYRCLRDHTGHDIISLLDVGEHEAAKSLVLSLIESKLVAPISWPEHHMQSIGG